MGYRTIQTHPNIVPLPVTFRKGAGSPDTSTTVGIQQIVVEGEPDANVGIAFNAGSGGGVGFINFGYPSGATHGQIQYSHQGEVFHFNPDGGPPELSIYGDRIQLGTYLVIDVFTDATRGSAGTAGRVIFNSDDSQLNIDDGTNWILPDGTTT